MKTKDRVLTAIAVLVAIIAPLGFGPYGIYILNIILVYALVALGLNVLLGMGGQISVGHAAFWAIGAYGSAIVVSGYGVPLIAGLFFGAILAMLAGLIVALPALRVQGHYLAIATLGFSIVVHQILFEWDDMTGGRQGMLVDRGTLFGLDLGSDEAFYYLSLVIVFIATWIVANFRSSINGAGLRALSMSPVAAQAMGVGRARSLFIAFAISAFLAGLSGALYAHLIGQLSTDSFTVPVSLSFFTMVVVGGMRSLTGAFLGAIFLALAPELLRDLQEAQTVMYGAILILCMHFLPGGLASIPQRLRHFAVKLIGSGDKS